MNNSCTIIISTMGRRINTLSIPNLCENIFYIIVHQSHKSTALSPYMVEILERSDVAYYENDSLGLSISRNFGISKATTQYAHITDDDTVIDVAKLVSLIQVARADEVAVATGRFIYENGLFPKKYKDVSYTHNKFTAAKVSSVEVVINVDLIRNFSIEFDERFGLGSSLPSGEEYIYITDCLKRDLKCKFYPITLCTHPTMTSGQDFFSNTPKIEAKRKMFNRIFGSTSFFYKLLFVLVKIRSVPHFMNKIKFFKVMLVGGGDVRK